MSTLLLSLSVISGGGGVIVFFDTLRLSFIFRLVLPTTGVDVCIPIIEEDGGNGIEEDGGGGGGVRGGLERGNRSLMG